MACLIAIEEKKIATEQLNFLFKTLLMLNVYCNSTIHNFALYEKYRNKKHEKKSEGAAICTAETSSSLSSEIKMSTWAREMLST